jgi:hypothetical protein
MSWMNEYEVDDAVRQFRFDPVLGPVTMTLSNLVVWTNLNSDGWPYWVKPARAATKLMELIQDAQKVQRSADMTDWSAQWAAQYKKALVPVKAFRTRQSAAFEIVEVK